MTSAMPVRCSTNRAMKPHAGSEVNLLSSFSREESGFSLPVASFRCPARKKSLILRLGGQGKKDKRIKERKKGLTVLLILI